MVVVGDSWVQSALRSYYEVGVGERTKEEGVGVLCASKYLVGRMAVVGTSVLGAVVVEQMWEAGAVVDRHSEELVTSPIV